jgi:hypothetical protein
MAIVNDLSQVGNSNEESYTEEEAVTIRRLIAENEALVDALDAKMDHLLLKRENHFDDIQRGKAALSPLKGLSQEILREVFLHASCITIQVPFPYGPEDYDEDDPNCEELHIMVPTQVVLAQVCSAWRKMAFSIPWLWNVMSIYHMKDNALPIAAELLSRARGSGITLHAEPWGYSVTSNVVDMLIMPNSFKYLRTKLSSEQLLQFCQQPLEACVNLESLLLNITHGDTTPHGISITLDPDKYPRFKHLSIHLFGDRFINLQCSIIPWHQLTTLYLRIVRSSQLNVLHQCTSLTSLEIEVDLDGINNAGEIVSLHCLLNFTLRASIKDVPQSPPLLRIFDFPNLEVFKADKLIGHFSEDIQELMLQQFNFRRIRVLDISRLTADNIDISAVLSCAPSLESLSLPPPMTMDQSTADQVAVGRLGPSLRCIDLVGYECSWDQALEFAETRWESVMASQESGSSVNITPFEKVRFNITKGYRQTPDQSRRKEALCSRGTAISYFKPLRFSRPLSPASDASSASFDSELST